MKKDIYDEFIHMKCLKCAFEVAVSADMFLEMREFYSNDYPEDYCPKCDKPEMVPLDIYNKIKGN